MIGQLHSVVIDAPDAYALARFYADLLGMEVSTGSPGDDWVVVTGQGYRLAFQQAPGLRPPEWPDPERPQQFHLDVRVADVEEAEPRVLALGAQLHRPGHPGAADLADVEPGGGDEPAGRRPVDRGQVGAHAASHTRQNGWPTGSA